MGKQLSALYDFVEDEKGLLGKMDLATRTKIPSSKAAATPDTPETVQRFIAAVREITGKVPPAV
ncbi:MAG: hypothetical protein HY903_23945 [Deltaproteobacteria bacterium]|nr:hypothetical protein [Deltaproteobacteria bacterium]